MAVRRSDKSDDLGDVIWDGAAGAEEVVIRMLALSGWADSRLGLSAAAGAPRLGFCLPDMEQRLTN